MSFIVQQNTPTVVDLANEARSTGWTIGIGYAQHEACNSGTIEVLPSVFTPISGQPYTISYQVTNLISGTIQLSIGTTLGISRNATGSYTETIVAGGINPKIKFYSDGNLRLQLIDVRSNQISTGLKSTNTIMYSESNDKWPSYLTFTSDFGFSFFKDLFTFKGGRMYKHDQSSTNRNNIYGVQYKTIFEFVGNSNVGQPKTYLALSYEGNQLMVTTEDGIRTSLGQTSELIDEDFLKATLDDGINQVNIYDSEGVYSSSFLRDNSDDGDIINGYVLKGTWIIVELIQANDELLKLKNITVHSEQSKIGAR